MDINFAVPFLYHLPMDTHPRPCSRLSSRPAEPTLLSTQDKCTRPFYQFRREKISFFFDNGIIAVVTHMHCTVIQRKLEHFVFQWRGGGGVTQSTAIQMNTQIYVSVQSYY
jgi:hypothetical protein